MNSKNIPTPYMWSYQPQSGNAAGASQDYSARMNTLSAGPSMINKVNAINNLRNDILMTQALITETPRSARNPRVWPAHQLIQPSVTQTFVTLPRDPSLQLSLTNSGVQLAGGGAKRFPIYYRDFVGHGIQLAGEHPSVSHLRADGIFQLAGGQQGFQPRDTILKLQASSSLPRSGGVGSKQFVAEFVPSVYLNPFSGPPSTFPDEFISNYDLTTETIAGYD
ncbi:pVIII [Bottlenose dolphin adenovirus 1]|uniref:Pre-hexon-linking protein VIII n=1 Tax=Bottlenose dolphin adenovirus 1 TaxID=1714377 RepID=A0A1X7MPZ1_9ADEN|nr:pVIII [Bottlenose dolphin adenovirus 1]SMG83455.1 pVIII [Bottlenose dolphin adenovirus 1]